MRLTPAIALGLLTAGLVVAGCGDSDRRRRGGPVDASADVGGDAAVDGRVLDSATDGRGPDSGLPDSGLPDTGAADTGAVDGGVPDTSTVDSGVPDTSPLDPLLSPAGAGGAACSTPGSMGECPGIAVCRFFTSAEGRCESCEPCGNLGGSCSSSDQCDILFVCYSGRCSNICPLGTSFCGPPDACLNVGHPTHGVCDPDR